MSKIVLFDLDGTLLDTEKDFTQILNAQLARHGYPSVPASRVRNTVSSGARALIKLGFGIDESDDRFAGLLEELLETYAERVRQPECVLFPGVAELLQHLNNQCIAWGIVTNKPSRFTLPLAEKISALAQTAVLICPDHLSNSKPDPEGILLACQRMARSPVEALYIGDHPKDMEAARAAGALGVGVRWGYIPEEHPIESWGADLIIDHPMDLIAHI